MGLVLASILILLFAKNKYIEFSQKWLTEVASIYELYDSGI